MMKKDSQKDTYRVLWAYLGENKIFQAYCAMKSSGKGYRHLLRNAGLNPNKYERHMEDLYRTFGNPCRADFETFWANGSDAFINIKDFSHDVRRKVKRDLAKLWNGDQAPSMVDVLDFIEDKVINRQLGPMIGSRNSLLLAVNVKNTKANELIKEFAAFIKEAELLIPPTLRRLEDLHCHLLITTSSFEGGKKSFQSIYGKPHRMSKNTYRGNPSRYINEVMKVQYNLLCGHFPGPKKLTGEQATEFAVFKKSGLL